MAEKTIELSDAIKKLMTEVVKATGDVDVETILNCTFQELPDDSEEPDWWTFIPDYMQRDWLDLEASARLTAYAVAAQQANVEEDMY